MFEDKDFDFAVPYYSHQGQFYIPVRMMGGIRRYIEEGIVPGDFLQSIICNDLKLACAYADEENLKNLPAYVSLFYNEVPGNAWGSRKIMQEWSMLRKEELRDVR